MSERELEQLEIDISDAKESVELMEQLVKLTSNRVFQKVVLDGYFVNEASRVVLLKADPSMTDDVSQKMLDNQITSIGQLRQYFGAIMHQGKMAKLAMTEAEETREEMLSGEV